LLNDAGHSASRKRKGTEAIDARPEGAQLKGGGDRPHDLGSDRAPPRPGAGGRRAEDHHDLDEHVLDEQFVEHLVVDLDE
jgi:hypothetical protein